MKTPIAGLVSNERVEVRLAVRLTVSLEVALDNPTPDQVTGVVVIFTEKVVWASKRGTA